MINLKIQDHGPISMVALKKQEGREQGTPHTQWDMRGFATAICSPVGVASIYLFPNQICLALINQNERVYHCYKIHVQESGFYIDIMASYLYL